ncbi:uncharacterized protein [Miscanthus floridulus]|uniref:uncharacterized protein isoform X2 n=1 Tax=Miscanthus floridulus TaxID=154761 RepID=UPI003457B49A
MASPSFLDQHQANSRNTWQHKTTEDLAAAEKEFEDLQPYELPKAEMDTVMPWSSWHGSISLLLFAVAACWMIVAAVSDIHAPETSFCQPTRPVANAVSNGVVAVFTWLKAHMPRRGNALNATI